MLQALLHLKSGNLVAAKDRLIASHKAFPRDIWSAQMRLRIASLDPAIYAEYLSKEIGFLLSHWKGRQDLAVIFLRSPALRPAIQEALPQADPMAAHNFLNLVEARF
jgi:hypothetical protein